MSDHSGQTQEGTQEEIWDARYRENERVWSGEPNAALVREAADLAPGRALDLGCGEGGDAVWLARQGWRVTAVDVSQVALDRAAGHAAEAGVADRVEWQRHDLGSSFPAGEYDLVSAHFLHSYGEFPRERILRAAAAAVAPGGVLLVVGHSDMPPGMAERHPDAYLPGPDEVLAGLELAPGAWEVLRCEEHPRVQTAPDGTIWNRTDNTVKVRRKV
ncbi:class I SAM-dependent methyltransferase [Allonocardiopsis opalescens]|uniref:Methyltransferase family protein n=1 Tax=Allonocardiopsis opalescens TaxID=1144618 RepID=A0A2T0Q571_9ACTN|nr:class I SAM-dependent methyltransferase [Allonocardiopsis opalescens]PRX98920.1 methyltransferase family protein [Allonocardiopsis opalescens]